MRICTSAVQGPPPLDQGGLISILYTGMSTAEGYRTDPTWLSAQLSSGRLARQVWFVLWRMVRTCNSSYCYSYWNIPNQNGQGWKWPCCVWRLSALKRWKWEKIENFLLQKICFHQWFKCSKKSSKVTRKTFALGFSVWEINMRDIQGLFWPWPSNHPYPPPHMPPINGERKGRGQDSQGQNDPCWSTRCTYTSAPFQFISRSKSSHLHMTAWTLCKPSWGDWKKPERGFIIPPPPILLGGPVVDFYICHQPGYIKFLSASLL